MLVVDNLSTGRTTNVPDECAFALVDIADSTLWTVMQQFRPQAVVNAAAQASVPVSVGQPQADARANVMGTLNLGPGIAGGRGRATGVREHRRAPVRPAEIPPDRRVAPREPISPYGLSKWTAEQYLRLLGDGKIAVKVLRLANVYGPRQSPDTEAGVISVFASRMLYRLPVTIHGDGSQTRDFVFVGDVARAAEAALSTPGEPTVHVSSGAGTSVREVFGFVAAETGYRNSPLFGPARAGDIRESVLSNGLARRWPSGGAPEMPLADGIAETVAWMRLGMEAPVAAVAG